MKLSKRQLSLLFYLETRAVDHKGRVDRRHVNDIEFHQMARWAEKGFIRFGRVVLEDVKAVGSNWVTLTEEAWNAVHAERRARAENVGGSDV